MLRGKLKIGETDTRKLLAGERVQQLFGEKSARIYEILGGDSAVGREIASPSYRSHNTTYK